MNQNYPGATPLGALAENAAPVDCPVCGAREMTLTEHKAGVTTQLVSSFLSLPHFHSPFLSSFFGAWYFGMREKKLTKNQRHGPPLLLLHLLLLHPVLLPLFQRRGA